MDNLLLNSLNIHFTWQDFLTNDVLSLLDDIYLKIKNDNTTPETKKILRFLELDLDEIKIIILGQDPYPQEGAATGRAFEVGYLKSWHETFRNNSLKNIIRTIYDAYNNKKLKFNDIKKELLLNKFNISTPNTLFKDWEKQGVMLLNTAFTCKIGQPNSHEKIWSPFTKKLLQFIASKELITWFLWGGNAKDITREICIKNKYINNHPMILTNTENDMMNGKTNPFRETKDIINWLGI